MTFGPTPSPYMLGRYPAMEYMQSPSFTADKWRDMPLVEVLRSHLLGANFSYHSQNEPNFAEGLCYSSQKVSSLSLACEDMKFTGNVSSQKEDDTIARYLLNEEGELKQQHSSVAQCSDQPTHIEEACLMNNSSSCNNLEEVTSSQGPNSSTSGNISENLMLEFPQLAASSNGFPSFADQAGHELRSGINGSAATRERKKRKRTRASKNSEEVESQRMTHIAVERNRRKQMNEHLSVLRSLMPESYIQRGDQASIIGGAIEFVKELEEVLHSLQLQKRKRDYEDGNFSLHSGTRRFFTDLTSNPHWDFSESVHTFDECRYRIVDSNSTIAEVEVKMAGLDGADVKVLAQKCHSQLLKAISAIESLHVTIMHLNITTIEQTVLYSFNLKAGADCKLQTGSDFAMAIQEIFRYTHANSVAEDH